MVNEGDNKMSEQKDISQSSLDAEKAVNRDIEKLAPLNVSKPKETKEGIQSAHKESADVSSIYSSIRDYIGSYISLADAKAGILIGIFSGLLSFSFINKSDLLKIAIKEWHLFDFFILGSWILFVLAIICALFVVWPKTLTNKKHGFVSWVHIANYKNIDEYLKDILSASNSHISEQICELNYDLSLVCKQKYTWLSRSFKAGLCGVVLILISLIKLYL